MNTCKNICETYRKYPDRKSSYECGLIAYCKNCSFMYYKEDIPKFRCPCCKTIVRTNKRTGKKTERWRKRY